MAQTADTFRKSTLDSRLLTAEEIDRALALLTPGEYPSDGKELAQHLVKRRLLTAYQAQEIYAGRGQQLILGNYVSLEKIGQGGMGLVLKARHRLMQRVAAIKILPAATSQNADAVARFRREFQTAGKLLHPNIVTAYDADEQNGVHYLAMEYIDGKDLASYVKSKGCLAPKAASEIIRQTARGLEYAHRQGVIHRDIKPQNLLIDQNGVVKILDMGLARLQSLAGSSVTELTGTGEVMGTVDYMAPEQAQDTKTADVRSDIYSLGATFWYLLTGTAMYECDTIVARLLAHREASIPSLDECCPYAALGLQAIFEKMVAKSPAARYQSMTEVLTALDAVLCEGRLVGANASSLASDPNRFPSFDGLEDKFGSPLPDGSDTKAFAAAQGDTAPILPRIHIAASPKTGLSTPRRSFPALLVALSVAGVMLLVVLVAVVVNVSKTTDVKPPTISKTPAIPRPSSTTQQKSDGSPAEEQPGNPVPSPAAPPSTPSAAPLNLLSPPNGFESADAWARDGADLVSSKNGGVANLKIAMPPLLHYRVDCEFTLAEEGDAFYIVLPAGPSQVEWGVNAHTAANLSVARRGFAKIGEEDLRKSPASREQRRLKIGERNRVSIEVRVDGESLRLKETFNDEPSIEWAGKTSEVHLPASYKWPEKNQIGCGVVNTVYKVHRFDLTPLKD